MTSGAAVPLTGGGKSGITGAGAVAAASPAAAGGALLRRGSRRFVAWLAVRRVVELREAQRSGGAGARFFTVSAGAESIPASSASVVNRFITSHPPAPFFATVARLRWLRRVFHVSQNSSNTQRKMVKKERNGLILRARRINPRIRAGQHHAHQFTAARSGISSSNLRRRKRSSEVTSWAGIEIAPDCRDQLNLFDVILQMAIIRRDHAAAAHRQIRGMAARDDAAGVMDHHRNVDIDTNGFSHLPRFRAPRQSPPAGRSDCRSPTRR